MPRKIGTGVQSFSKLRERGSFFVDKTEFISDWWNAADEVTLITRPRRFGKTLNMSMLECFFSPEYAGRADLFRRNEYQSFHRDISCSSLSIQDASQASLSPRDCPRPVLRVSAPSTA